jgi:hypothetical protein
VEYVYGSLVNNVVKNFKGIAVPIKTDKQIFVFVRPPALIEPAIVPDSIKGPTNVRPVTSCLKAEGLNAMIRSMF